MGQLWLLVTALYSGTAWLAVPSESTWLNASPRACEFASPTSFVTAEHGILLYEPQQGSRTTKADGHDRAIRKRGTTQSLSQVQPQLSNVERLISLLSEDAIRQFFRSQTVEVDVHMKSISEQFEVLSLLEASTKETEERFRLAKAASDRQYFELTALGALSQLAPIEKLENYEEHVFDPISRKILDFEGLGESYLQNPYYSNVTTSKESIWNATTQVSFLDSYLVHPDTLLRNSSAGSTSHAPVPLPGLLLPSQSPEYHPQSIKTQRPLTRLANVAADQLDSDTLVERDFQSVLEGVRNQIIGGIVPTPSFLRPIAVAVGGWDLPDRISKMFENATTDIFGGAMGIEETSVNYEALALSSASQADVTFSSGDLPQYGADQPACQSCEDIVQAFAILGDPVLALNELQKEKSDGKLHSDALYYSAVLSASQGQLSAAADFYRQYLQAVQDGPKSRVARMELALYDDFLAGGDRKQLACERLFERSISHSRLLFRQRQFHDALTEALVASSFKPKDWEPYAIAAAVFTNARNYVVAERFLDQAIKLANSSQAKLIEPLAVLIRREKDVAETIFRATSMIQVGHYVEAKIQLESLLERFPSRDDVALGLACACLASAEFDRAASILRSLRASKDVLVARRALSFLKDLERKSVTTYLKTDAETLADEALIDVSRGRLFEAEQKLLRAIALEPNYYRWHFELARLKMHDKQWEIAAECLERAIDCDSSIGILFAELGACLAQAAQWSRALMAYASAVKLDPLDESHWDGAGSVAYNAKQYDLAVRYFQRAVSLNPDNEVFREHLRTAQARAGGRLW